MMNSPIRREAQVEVEQKSTRGRHRSKQSFARTETVCLSIYISDKPDEPLVEVTESMRTAKVMASAGHGWQSAGLAPNRRAAAMNTSGAGFLPAVRDDVGMYYSDERSWIL